MASSTGRSEEEEVGGRFCEGKVIVGEREDVGERLRIEGPIAMGFGGVQRRQPDVMGRSRRRTRREFNMPAKLERNTEVRDFRGACKD